MAALTVKDSGRKFERGGLLPRVETRTLLLNPGDIEKVKFSRIVFRPERLVRRGRLERRVDFGAISQLQRNGGAIKRKRERM